MLNPVTVALSTGTTVLSCRWPESGTRPELGTRPVCQVEDDFSFNHNVTDRLTLEIPVAMEQTTGLCACSVVSNSDGRPVQACNLTFKSKILFSSLSSLSVCLSVCLSLSLCLCLCLPLSLCFIILFDFSAIFNYYLLFDSSHITVEARSSYFCDLLYMYYCPIFLLMLFIFMSSNHTGSH